VVVDEEVGGLLLAEVFNRVRPEQVAHRSVGRRLLEPVDLINTYTTA